MYIKNKKVISAILFLVIILGALIRFKGYTLYGLTADDEYYIIKSIRNIFERGLPEFATGGYYTRGLLYQYLSAGLILFGLDDITALRLITVICNILSIPVLYLIARKVTNSSFALVAVFLFTFSAWEIEISRLARFYTPFELIFLIYIYILLDVIANNKSKNYKWLFILSILGILAHEEGIFLIILNFLPLYISPDKLFKKSNFIITISVFIFGALLTLSDFRSLGVTNYLPNDIVLRKGSSSPIYIPKLLISFIVSKTLWLIVFAIICFVFMIYMRYFIRKEQTKLETKFYFFLIGLAALLNLFGLVVLLTLILIFSKKLNENNFQKPEFIRLAVFLCITSIFYLLFEFTNHEWLKWFNESFSLNKLIWVLINYPDFYEKFFVAWLVPFPFLTIIILISLGVITFLYLKKFFTKTQIGLSEQISYLMLVVLILLFLVSVIVTPFMNLRYWFFIYPIFIVFITYVVYRLSQRFKSIVLQNIIAILFAVIIFFISEDHNLKHLLSIDSIETTFRTNFKGKLAETYYFKEDYKTPAEVIKKNMQADDIIISTVAPIDYYLPKLDYLYRDYLDPEFKGRSRKKGTIEIWTNSKLLYKENQLTDLIKRGEKNVWLIAYTSSRRGAPQFDKDLFKKYSNDLFYTNLDRTLYVFFIKKNKNSADFTNEKINN